jgi:hypothetical protein
VGLVFSPALHLYTYDGRPVPSVTTVLRDAGLINFDHVPEYVLDRARERGQFVHQALHYLLEGTLDLATVDPHLQGYVTAAHTWLIDSGFQPLSVEHRLYHPVYQYAGTADLVGNLDGRPTVADWKTGRASDAVADLQLAAYAAALREMPIPEWFGMSKTTPIQRFSIEVAASGKYAAHRYTEANDFPVFLNCLTVYREQQRRGVRKVA